MERRYPHLNLEERRKLAKWLDAKIPIKEIADNLAIAPSTIYREIRRNFYHDEELQQLNGYHAVLAKRTSPRWSNVLVDKGRVDRAHRTLQDRLVKELRLTGISDMEAGNTYLQGFNERHNAQFAKAPAKPDNLHRALNVEPDRLDDVL